MNFVNIILISIALIGATSGLRLPKISPYVNECPIDEPLDFFPHETNCTLFYICSHGTLTVTECPDDLHFNPVAKVCDYQEQAGCMEMSTVSTDEPDTTIDTTTPTIETTTDVETTTDWCRNSNIYLSSHESDCTKFYAQIAGNSYLLGCKNGMEFNHDAQNCVKITKDCAASKLMPVLKMKIFGN